MELLEGVHSLEKVLTMPLSQDRVDRSPLSQDRLGRPS